MERKFELMLIDDDEIFLMLNGLELQRSGFYDAPQKFSLCEEAIDHLKATDQPDRNILLFLDINMPVLDGWDFLTVLRRYHLKSNIKVVMLAASVDPRDQMKAKSFKEVVAYFEKPLTKSSLEKLRDMSEMRDFFG